uniref:SH3 domain-containing protein n=1 Tax=Cairina moschata TaxID=8855 RepID=A0A8C3BQ23_CAIMO
KQRQALEAKKCLLREARTKEEYQELQMLQEAKEKLVVLTEQLEEKCRSLLKIIQQASKTPGPPPSQSSAELQAQLQEAECQLKALKEIADRGPQLEREHLETQLALQKKEEELESLQRAQEEGKRQHEEALQMVRAQVADLEDRCHHQTEQLNEQSSPATTRLPPLSHDPADSPNEHPELELPLTAGQFVYVIGEMDEDGWYIGERTDGSRGFIPSNLVEEVFDDLSFLRSTNTHT